MNINYLKNSKDIEADNAIIRNLEVSGSLSGNINISPLNIQSDPPNSVTVDKFSKLSSVIGGIVDTTSLNQQIENSKIFNSGCLTNINNGYLGVRNDTTPTNFLHTLSYDANTASILACTSDTNIVETGFVIGSKFLNNKANATKEKFGFAYRSDINTSKMLIEQKLFLDMVGGTLIDNYFNLRNLNSIGIGTGSPSSAITIIKDGVAQQEIFSTNNKARLKLTGPEAEVAYGPDFTITNEASNSHNLWFKKSPTISFMNYNSSTGCLSTGDNNNGDFLNFCVFNAGMSNKVVKLPLMTTSQELTFAAQLPGSSSYVGATYFNPTGNRLCFVDSLNNIHRISGTMAASGNILSGDLIVESQTFSDKKGSIQIDNTQTDATHVVFMPKTGNVELANLEGVTGNIQTQLDGKVSTSLLSSTTLSSSVINSSLKNFGIVSSLTMEGNINMGNNSLTNVLNINSIPVSTIARKNDANTFTQTNTFSSGVLNVNGNSSAKIRLTETGTPAIFDVISESTGFKIHNVQTTQDWVRISTDGFDIHETLPFTRGGSKALSKNRLEEATDPDANTDFNNGYDGGSMWYNDAKKKMFFNVKSDAGQAEWADYSIENLTFNDSATFETSYVTICSFMPDKAGVNAYDVIVNSGATKMDVRIYNLSEASTLCELTDIDTAGNPDIRTMNPPSIPYFYPNHNFTYQLQIRSTDANVVSILALRKR